MSTPILTNLHIKNFRLLQDLTIKHLAQVNLLVGRNNVGKSTILEALRIYASLGNPRVLEELLNEHDETFNVTTGDQLILPVENFFTQRRFPTLDHNQEIYIGNTQGTEYIKLQRVYFTTEEVPLATTADLTELNQLTALRNPKQRKEITGNLFSQLFSQNLLKQALKITCKNSLLSSPTLAPRFEPPGTLEIWFEFDSYQKNKYQLTYSELQQAGALFALGYVPTNLIATDVLALIWDEIALTDAESIVMTALRLVAPQLQGLTFKKRKHLAPFLSERIAVIKSAEEDQPVPLKSAGDGLLRVLQLVLSMLQAKGGFLFIDEFDNGLHYTVLPKVWELIFQLAQTFKVQVFATSHSWDCVKSFYTVWESQADQGSFYRLNHYPGEGVSAMLYECEILGYAVEREVEMR